MKRLPLFCVLSAGLFASGCVGFYTDMSHLSEQELEWTNCYNIGDTVLFYSDSGKVDTLAVDFKELNNISNPFFIHFLDDYMGDKYNAKSMYAFYIKNSSDSIRGVLKMEKLVEKDSIEWDLRLFNRYTVSWPYTHDFKADRNIYRGDNPIKVRSVVFGNKLLHDCILVDDSNSELITNIPEDADTIQSFIVSKDFGLICYKYSNGEEFCRRLD